MVNQDFSQLADTLLVKTQILFSDDKIAKLAFALAALMLLCACYGLAMFGLHVNSWQLPDPYSYTSKTVLPEITNNVYNKNKHIFGKVTKPGATLANAVKSSLSLTLKGVMNESDPKLGAAIIAGPDNVEKDYHVGDKLPIENARVTLEYIYQDRVYIKNDDTIEYLLYPKLEFKNQPGAKTSGTGNSSYLPRTQDNTSDSIAEPIDNFQEKNPESNQENIERMPAEEVEKVSSNNSRDYKLNRFNKLNKKHKRNYN